MTDERLYDLGVAAFPLSQTRPTIMEGFRRMVGDLKRLAIPCSLVVDGSFLTEEIDPQDIDFAVVVTPEFYEECAPEQLEYLDWIRDSREMKTSHLCDCYLCVEFPEGHDGWFQGIQNRAFWVDLFATSKVHKRVRGVGILQILEVS